MLITVSIKFEDFGGGGNPSAPPPFCMQPWRGQNVLIVYVVLATIKVELNRSSTYQWVCIVSYNVCTATDKLLKTLGGIKFLFVWSAPQSFLKGIISRYKGYF